MRRLAGLLALCALLLAPAGCRKKRLREAPKMTEEAGLATMIQAADPRAAVQLVSGFYAVENDSWRWTAHKFAAALHPPRASAVKGARLVLKFAIADVSIAKLKSMKISAKVNGLELEPEEYTKAGDQTYTRDVPASALAGDAITVEFTVDKFLPPTAQDERELAIIVSAVGFEAK